MANKNRNCGKAFSLDDVRDISIGDLLTIALGTEQSLRMIIDNQKGEAVFCLLLLNMADYEKWGQLLSAVRKPLCPNCAGKSGMDGKNNGL